MSSPGHNAQNVDSGKRSSDSRSGRPARTSYAEAARDARPPPEATAAPELTVDPENDVPGRPLTAFFRPRSFLPADDVFQALTESGIDGSNISCVQRQSSGDIVLTFRQQQFKDEFLKKSFLTVCGAPFALQDVDKPLTYLQIFDAPHEMPDTAIIQRLSKFCEVFSHRRGMFRFPGWENVQDGVRHYRVQLKQPIPNFMRFGTVLVHFRYEGQPRTCRHCHQTGHVARTCHSIICYNCDQTGHLAPDCPEPILCNICKAEGHTAKNCPFSWSRAVPGNAHDNNDNNNDDGVNEEEQDGGPSNPAPAEESEAVTVIEDDDADDPMEDGDDEFLSPREDEADDEDETEIADSPNNAETPRLFSPSAPHSPKPPSANGRKPAKPSTSTVPGRTPTQPVLVTGKITNPESPTKPVAPVNEDSSKAKRGNSPLAQRTTKHKKRK